MEIIDFSAARFDDFEQRAIRRRVERGELDRLRPGAFVTPSDEDPEIRHLRLMRATVRRLATDSTVSHVTAALLHGLPVLRSRIGPVMVTRQRSNGRRTTYVHARRAPLAPHEVTVVRGFRVTTIARTVRDLALTLPFDEALSAADVALRKGVDLQGALMSEKMPTRVRRVVEHADPLAESMGESMSRAVFIRSSLPMPKLQFIVRGSGGQRIARCDFGWPEWNVVGEFDGGIKYAGAEASPSNLSPQEVILLEKNREQNIREQGYDVPRWDWSVMRDPARLLERVHRALTAKGYMPGRDHFDVA